MRSWGSDLQSQGPRAPNNETPAFPPYTLSTEVLSRLPPLLPGGQVQLQAMLGGAQGPQLQQLLQQLLGRQAQEQQQGYPYPQAGYGRPPARDHLGPAGYQGLQVLQHQLQMASSLSGPAEALGPPLPPQHLQHHPQPPQPQPPPSGEDTGFSLGPTGLKIRVVCNDVRGMLYLDDQYVSCYCVDCEARVRAGHDRPIFGLSRFEKHCGSKAKKWRTSLRVEPGSCPEVKPSDAPMPVGQFLSLKGLGIKGKGKEGNDSDGEFMPSPRAKRPRFLPDRRSGSAGDAMMERSASPEAPIERAGTAGNVAVTLLHMRQEALPGETSRGAGASTGAQPRSPKSRPQATPLGSQHGLAGHADIGGSGGPKERGSASRAPPGGLGPLSSEQARAGDGRAPTAAWAVPGSEGRRGAGGSSEVRAAAGAGAGAPGWSGDLVLIEESSPVVTEAWLHQQRLRFEALLAPTQEGAEIALTGAVAMSAKHAAIFRLVFGLLQGANQRLFSETYMPWLNDLGPLRLDREFSTLANYLSLLTELPWRPVWHQMMAYLQGNLRRIVLLAPTLPGSMQFDRQPSSPRSPPLPPEDACHGSLPHAAQLGAAGGAPASEPAEGAGAPKEEPLPEAQAPMREPLFDQPQQQQQQQEIEAEAAGAHSQPRQARQGEQHGEQVLGPAGVGPQAALGQRLSTASLEALQEYLQRLQSQQQAYAQGQGQQQPFADGGRGRRSQVDVLAAWLASAGQSTHRPAPADLAAISSLLPTPQPSQQQQQQWQQGLQAHSRAGAPEQPLRLAHAQRPGQAPNLPDARPVEPGTGQQHAPGRMAGSADAAGSSGGSLPDLRLSSLMPQLYNVLGMLQQHKQQQQVERGPGWEAWRRARDQPQELAEAPSAGPQPSGPQSWGRGGTGSAAAAAAGQEQLSGGEGQRWSSSVGYAGPRSTSVAPGGGAPKQEGLQRGPGGSNGGALYPQEQPPGGSPASSETESEPLGGPAAWAGQQGAEQPASERPEGPWAAPVRSGGRPGSPSVGAPAAVEQQGEERPAGGGSGAAELGAALVSGWRSMQQGSRGSPRRASSPGEGAVAGASSPKP